MGVACGGAKGCFHAKPRTWLASNTDATPVKWPLWGLAH